MKYKKDIDRLFQEKFKNFEEVPREEVWRGIQSDLNKRKKRVIPLWIKLSGAAAVLLVALLAGKAIFFVPQASAPLVNETSHPAPNITPETVNAQNTPAQTSTVAAIDSATHTSTHSALTEENHNAIVSKSQPKTQSKSKINSSTSPLQHPAQNAAETYAKPSNTIAQTTVAETENSDSQITSEKNAVENNTQKATGATQAIADIKANKPSSTPTLADKNSNKHNPEKESVPNLAEVNQPSEASQKPSLLEEVAKRQEEALAAQQSSKDDFHRLIIRPNVAPIFYGSLDGGSAVDPKFAHNSTQTEVTMAYGIDVAYAVSKRFKVRAGVSRVNMSYSTRDIAFSSSPQAVSLKGVERNKNIQNMAVIQGFVAREHNVQYETNAVMPYTPGKLNQQMEYIEVPVVVEYAVLNERFGINLIGGFSTLFLDDDHVQINSRYGRTALGESSNINDVSFTTNVGLGFDYDISNMLNFSVEPMFKYQLNAFSGDTGNFKPYYFGIYTGLAFKF